MSEFKREVTIGVTIAVVAAAALAIIATSVPSSNSASSTISSLGFSSSNYSTITSAGSSSLSNYSTSSTTSSVTNSQSLSISSTMTSSTTNLTLLTEMQTQVTDSQGLTLILSDNGGNSILPNDSLQFNVSLYNPSSELVNLSASQSTWHFPFVGFPIAPSPPCYWGSPYEFVLLKGDYNASSLTALLASGPATSSTCHAGVPARWYAFEPQAYQANLTGGCLYATCSDAYGTPGHSGTYPSNATVTMAGSYDPSDLPNGVSIPYVSPPPSTPSQWQPGANYTLAVGDAWGGLAVLHFVVLDTTSPMVISPYTCFGPYTYQQAESIPGDDEVCWAAT